MKVKVTKKTIRKKTKLEEKVYWECPRCGYQDDMGGSCPNCEYTGHYTDMEFRYPKKYNSIEEYLLNEEGKCESCIHHDTCGYFDFDNSNLTEEEAFAEHCVGCCCGDGAECNRDSGYGCTNWEDGSKPLMG
jgi:hypothetical protein